MGCVWVVVRLITLLLLDTIFQNLLILHKISQFRYSMLKYELTDLHIFVKLGIFLLKLQKTIIIIQNIRSLNIINLSKHSAHNSFDRFNLSCLPAVAIAMLR